MQHNFADRLLHDPKFSENVNVITPQSLILRQVASARAVITDLLSSSTERTLAMSRIQILWLSNQISANTHLNIYQNKNMWRLKQKHISKTVVLFHLITTPRSSVASHHQIVWRKLHELSRLFARSDIEENHSNRIDTGPFAGLTGIFRRKRSDMKP